jgi:hypothetical protein
VHSVHSVFLFAVLASDCRLYRGSEWISRNFAARWSPLCFVGLMVVGGSYLLYVLKGRYPELFANAERSMVPMGIIVRPTGATLSD